MNTVIEKNVRSENVYDHTLKILKVLNNNVVLTIQDRSEKIIFSKGIGYKKHAGDTIGAETIVDKIFSIEDKENSEKFNELIRRTDSSIVGLCEEIIAMIDREFNEELDEKIHIGLIDHIAFTLSRLKANDEISNPFLIEIETLYRQEYEVAKKAVAILEKQSGIKIPDGEAGFIALHIHSARNKGKLSNTIKYAYLASSIAELIEDEFDLEIDRESLDYARFVIHIRFAVERIMNNNPIKNMLLNEIKKKLKSSYKIANKAGKLIENQLGVKVVEDEIGYITVHIERLKNTS